jgi:CheY-like chemotaxis protein
MGTRKKTSAVAATRVLLVDDDKSFLELYREIFSQHLTCLPEVKTAASTVRALALLQGEPFKLVMVDLDLPQMDGLQFLAVARRKYPNVCLVVLTGIRDEQFRTRAYAMGADQYWLKPESEQEMGLLLEAMDALLKKGEDEGFRGYQSKSLMDIIQLECLSQNSCQLKISHDKVEGRIWIQSGEVIDAEAAGLRAEPAFRRILSWKSGNFEVLPADPNRPRRISTSYQGLLLNTVQALDEAAAQDAPVGAGSTAPGADDASGWLAQIAQLPGIEFLLINDATQKEAPDCWGLDKPQYVAEWMEQTLGQFQTLGEQLHLGPLRHVIGAGPYRKLALAPYGQAHLCVGFAPNLPADQVQQTLHQVITQWAS